MGKIKLEWNPPTTVNLPSAKLTNPSTKQWHRPMQNPQTQNHRPSTKAANPSTKQPH